MIGYFFPYCFLKIFVGGQGFDGGVQSHDGGLPQFPPLGKALEITMIFWGRYKKCPRIDSHEILISFYL